MQGFRFAVLLLCAVSLGVPALADRPKVKVKDRNGEYEYEYEDARCKFKYKLKLREGEEEVEEEGDCPPARALPQFAPPVPFRGAARADPRRVAGSFCDRALAGAIAGTAAGGAIGSQVASGDDRTVAIVLGGILGGVLGHEIGRRIDEADRRCMGRALARAEPGVEVGWTNPESGMRYDLRGFGPVEDRHGVACRSFRMRVEGGQWRDAEACRRGDGGWQLVELR